METVSFTVPLVPPSVNHYCRHTRSGRHYVTKEAEAFQEAVAMSARGRRVRGDSYQVLAWIYLGKKQRGDIDNFGKCLLDSLVYAGVIDTDSKVTVFALHKGREEKPRTTVEISVRRSA